MSYKYRSLVAELDRFVASQANSALAWHWSFIKQIMDLHAEQYGSKADSWLQFEQCSEYASSDECVVDDLIPHACISLFNTTAPDWAEANFHLEVAFGRARGMTRKDAIAEHYKYLESEGGYKAVYGQKDPRNPQPKLKVIKGGHRAQNRKSS